MISRSNKIRVCPFVQVTPGTVAGGSVKGGIFFQHSHSFFGLTGKREKNDK